MTIEDTDATDTAPSDEQEPDESPTGSTRRRALISVYDKTGLLPK